MKNENVQEADVIIVGAGAAGLMAALTLAQKNTGGHVPRRVVMINEVPLDGDCSSRRAQAGIAAAVGAGDTPDIHAADTMKAAAGTADAAVVRALTAESPRYIEILARYGVKFDYDENGDFKLSREACHAHRRVLKAKAGDGFGAELMRALALAVRKTPAITLAEGFSAERLIMDGHAVRGLVTRRVADGKRVVFAAPAVVLATGGIGGLYAATTNPLHAVGRGIALAARAGAVLSDLEFVQFHPTALDIGEDPAPLATEALRGEGATLVNSRGERFMQDYHEMAELAPRDVVSRGIFAQMQQGRKVYLDCRHIDVTHFPALLSACARGGVDPQKELVPVMPAVHYHMGGIATDLFGRSSIAGLWAAGECAATGLHGANRLASNSLMEAVIMGARAASDIFRTVIPAQAGSQIAAAHALPAIHAVGGAGDIGLPAEQDAIRQIMSDSVGVIRDAQELKGAIMTLKAIENGARDVDAKTADMAFVGRLIAGAALARTESRGAHCRSDCPDTSWAWQKRSFTTLPLDPARERTKERVAQ